ncbi:hypothetical protein AB9C23_25515, partial [Citrobacter freundii]
MAKKWYDRVVSTLEQLIEWKGKPAAIRCDSGPEYTGNMSAELRVWFLERYEQYCKQALNDRDAAARETEIH